MTLWDPTQYKLTGYDVPEHGGAGYPALICTRCGEEIIGADGPRQSELEPLRGWGSVLGFDRAILIAEEHECSDE